MGKDIFNGNKFFLLFIDGISVSPAHKSDLMFYSKVRRREAWVRTALETRMLYRES